MGRITLDKVAKSFGEVEVIPPLDLTIEDGEFVVFVGPSGCGKSTLLRLIAGLEDVSAGEIRIDGKDATAVPPAKRGLAMVFQSYALYPHMSVRKNIAFPLRMAGLDAAEQERRVRAAADVLNLTDYLDRRPGQLSGGQRQRVAIGRAIVREPSAFLFDEPLSNLDAALRVGMRLEISELHNRLKTTMIYVTHDQVEAMTMADKIAVLRDGVLEQFGAPLDLYNRPRNIFVAGFIGSPKMNFITGRVAGADRRVMELETGERIDLPGTGFAQRPGEAVTLGIRPNDLRPAGAGAITMAVRSVEQLGGESYVYGQLENDTPVTLHNPGQTSVRPGEVIAVDAVPGQLHLFDSETGQSLREETTR